MQSTLHQDAGTAELSSTLRSALANGAFVDENLVSVYVDDGFAAKNIARKIHRCYMQ